MGAVAEAVGNGLGPEHVIGVIPAALEPREVSRAGQPLPSMCITSLQLPHDTRS